MMEFDLSTCVEKDQEMDPATEEMLPGDCLRNGMRVLSCSEQRVGMGSVVMTSNLARAKRVKNRWCTVTHLSFYDDDLVFIGIYDDGIQEQRVLGRKWAWVVKRDSIRPTLFQRIIAWCRTH